MTRLLVAAILCSAIFISSCQKQCEEDKVAPALAGIEKRLSALEARQSEMMRQVKTMTLRDRAFKRFVKKSLSDGEANQQTLKAIKKDIASAQEKDRAFARVVNKIIDSINNRKEEIRGLKRKFYVLWRLTVKAGKLPKEFIFTGPKVETPPQAVSQPKQAPAQESEKSKRNKKKLKEGMA